jgi:hypothetical protein
MGAITQAAMASEQVCGSSFGLDAPRAQRGGVPSSGALLASAVRSANSV